jgi:hypothetical protein
MKKEVRMLLQKATDSLVISVEHFNRPSDRGRVSAVLISLDHSFEMLLKASILHRGGRIRKRRERQTIGYDACVRICLSEEPVRFLTNNQAITLQAINSLRDAAYHHIVEVSEPLLYLHAQAGLTLFRDIYRTITLFELYDVLPKRVLPLSTTPPTDLTTLFDNETQEIQRLLQPKTRKVMEANAKLRTLAILDSSIRGEKLQPTEGDLKKLARSVMTGRTWTDIFPGVAALDLTSEGYGPSFEMRLTKKSGIPVELVKEGTPAATIVAIKRVNELDFYSLGLADLAKKLGLTEPLTLALIRCLKLQDDEECFKPIQISSSRFKRYSPKALERLRQAASSKDMKKVWSEFGTGGRRSPATT